MSYLKEAVVNTVSVGVESLTCSDRYSCLSPTMTKGLLVGLKTAFPKVKVQTKDVATIVDVIVGANNYFDVTLPLLDRINDPYKTLTAITVFQETRRTLDKSIRKLCSTFTEQTCVIDRFLEDGGILSKSRAISKGNEVEYREIDSALSAVLILSLICPQVMKDVGVDAQMKCKDYVDLRKKYSLFLIHGMSLEINRLTVNQKKVIGMQAIEMGLAIVDDLSAGDDDKVLGISNTWDWSKRHVDPLKSTRMLVDEYNVVAQKCGFSGVVYYVSLILSLAHAYSSNTHRMASNGVDLHEINKIDLTVPHLRESLNSVSILSEMAK